MREISGYYTSTRAMQVLGINSSNTLSRWVKDRGIRTYSPQGLKRQYYRAEDVDRIAAKLDAEEYVAVEDSTPQLERAAPTKVQEPVIENGNGHVQQEAEPQSQHWWENHVGDKLYIHPKPSIIPPQKCCPPHEGQLIYHDGHSFLFCGKCLLAYMLRIPMDRQYPPFWQRIRVEKERENNT